MQRTHAQPTRLGSAAAARLCAVALLSVLLGAPPPAAAGTSTAPGCNYTVEWAWPGVTWDAASPISKCVEPVALADAIDFAESNAGGSGVIIRDGKRIGGWGPPAIDYTSASAAKTGTTGLAGLLARGDGLFDDSTLAQPINSAVPSPTITLRMLLTMGSGIHHTDCGRFNAPEGTWSYSNCGMDHAADTIGTLVGDLENYLQTRVYLPIGASVSWDHRPPRGDVGLNWSVEDAARLMLLFLREGEWDGQQLVDADELADAIQVANPSAPFEFPNEYIHNGRLPPTFYGSGFWLNSGNVMADVPEDLVVGMGALGCENEFFMAYSAATDIIVVRAGDSLRTSEGCDALHYEGNEDLLAMVFDAVLTDPVLPPTATPTATPAPTPEPGLMLQLASGMFALVVLDKCRRNANR